MADYRSDSSSLDGVQVLDLTTPTPAPKLPRARALSPLSRKSRSPSPPAESRPLTAASPKFRSKGGSGAAGDNSDDDFDMRTNWQPSTQRGRTSAEGNKGKGKARASEASASSSAGALRGSADEGAASGGMLGKGKGMKAAEDKGYEFALGAGAGVVEVLSDSDDGGRPASGRLQQTAESGDDEDCASVDIPNELEGFDSLMLASQTSMISASQHSLSSLPGSGSSGGRRRSRDLSKSDRDQLSSGPDFGADSYGGGRGACTDEIVRLEDDDDEEDDDFVLTTQPSPTRERRRGGAMGAAGERGRETGVTDDAALSKERKAFARKEVTANRKRAREEAAAAAKQQKERERAVRKGEKERAKLLEKEKRAAQKERDQQARGNFSHLEIACVMERGFFECPGNARAVAGAAKQPSGTEEFMVAAADCVVPGAVWWTRRAHLRGGAAASGHGVMMLDMLVVVMRADLVLEKLEQSGDGRGSGDDDEIFPDLGNYVDRVRSGAPGFNRLVLILEGAEQELHRRWGSHKANGSPESKMEDLEDAMSWLLIHKDAETTLTKSSEETGQYLWDLTRALSNMPYKDDVTELHCVSRSKSKAAGSESLDAFEQELADSWVRMLEQIPGISGPKAVEIAKHYCLPRALAAALTDPTVPEKERAVLLADKMGGTRYEGKRARTVFDLFTQEDGDFVLS